jgi:ppGpp synthetase/RelA/SpoT-type nucleotidyltranferase
MSQLAAQVLPSAPTLKYFQLLFASSINKRTESTRRRGRSCAEHSAMTLIENFLARYRKEFDFYDQAARLVAQALDASLHAAGIRSIVTSRAKSLIRLETKVSQRAADKNYTTVDDIYNDIVDLAGARVALYFPGERDQVDTLIKSLFVLTGPTKQFPSASSQPAYKKRFAGYCATHYRVQLRESALSDAQKRYAEAKVEIQVASVLMHAWAEVEHDLVYKPLEGPLSEDEYAILDELNGLVMAGEIALERLQRAGEARVASADRRFSNHYDLAAYLLTQASAMLKGPLGDNALGRMDLLFGLLMRLNIMTPDQLSPYVAALHGDVERRPIAEQIVDRLLSEDETRYKVYEEVRQSRLAATAPARADEVGADQPDLHEAIGFFLSEWVRFERLLRESARIRQLTEGRTFVSSGRLIEKLGIFDPATRNEIERIRRMRNNLVHGIEVPDAADLRDAGERLHGIVEVLGAQKEGE